MFASKHFQSRAPWTEFKISTNDWKLSCRGAKGLLGRGTKSLTKLVCACANEVCARAETCCASATSLLLLCSQGLLAPSPKHFGPDQLTAWFASIEPLARNQYTYILPGIFSFFSPACEYMRHMHLHWNYFPRNIFHELAPGVGEYSHCIHTEGGREGANTYLRRCEYIFQK